MARNWTEAQQQAISSRKGTVLVSAAAGSGKTAVLVERVIQRITDSQNPVNVEDLLVVTFTKAAAAEMKERIAKRLSELIREQPRNQYLKRQKMYLSNAQISTMDSFCGKLVKENFEKAGVAPDYGLHSDVEHDLLKREVLNEVLEKLYSRPEDETEDFLKLFSNGRSDYSLTESVLSLYELAMASQNPLKWVENVFSDYLEDLPIYRTGCGKYCLERLKELILYVQIKAEDIIEDAPENSNLKGAIINDLTPVLSELAGLLKLVRESPENWDEIMTHTCSLKFGRFPTIPKEEKDCYYEDIKGRRDGIKKYFSQMSSIFVCTEAQYQSDMEYLRPIMMLLKDVVVDFITLLQQKKEENNTYYFSDILHFALKILVNFNDDGTYTKTQLANELSDSFAEILIDEFQDTNEAQDTLFTVISKDNSNKFMVGDVKQSVYRFRQAMPEIFMGYKDSFPEFSGDNYPATINLDKNFRSRSGIINGINFIFDYIMTRKLCSVDYKNGEQLRFGGNYDESCGTDVCVQIVESDNSRGSDLVAEARHIGNEIKNLVSSGTLVGKKGEERPIKYSDICILMRAVKDKAEIVARELENMNIPVHFTKKGGFFDSREVVTVISMLKIIDNPVQDVPLASVMLSPLFPFTEDDLAKYRCDNRKGNFYNVVKAHYDCDKKVKDFIDLLSLLRTLSVTMDIGSLIRRIFEETSYDSIVGAMDNGEKRILNLELLISYAENYEANGGSGLSGFIRYLDKIRKNNKDLESANEISENDNVVRIMSIHKSKGLEFPVVFVADCASSIGGNDKNKVRVNRKAGIATPRYFPDLHKDLPTLQSNTVKLFEKQEEVAEQIRVLYVAMTRAEEKLYLIGSMFNPQKKIAELYYNYFGNFTDTAVPLSLCSSYMQWILLALMTHPAFDFPELLSCCKNPDSPEIDFAIYEKCQETETEEKKKPQFNADKEVLEILYKRLSYKYPYAALTDIPVKYAASAMEKDVNLKYLASENPAFSGAGDLTPAQRGTLVHRFMEKCDIYNCSDINAEISRLVDNNVFTPKEAESINVGSLKAFFDSSLYKRITSAEKYVREQEFSMVMPVSLVNDNLPEGVSDEKVIVQGVIDGLIINGDTGEIVDYKTDRVSTEQELCERYSEQMKMYKRAAEECFGLRNVTITLYSFHLSKEISLKL